MDYLRHVPNLAACGPHVNYVLGGVQAAHARLAPDRPTQGSHPPSTSWSSIPRRALSPARAEPVAHSSFLGLLRPYLMDHRPRDGDATGSYTSGLRKRIDRFSAERIDRYGNTRKTREHQVASAHAQKSVTGCGGRRGKRRLGDRPRP